jgi:hypothetical protein
MWMGGWVQGSKRVLSSCMVLMSVYYIMVMEEQMDKLGATLYLFVVAGMSATVTYLLSGAQ